jgi:hypothetical protein
MAADKRKRRFSTYILPILFCGLLIALAVLTDRHKEQPVKGVLQEGEPLTLTEQAMENYLYAAGFTLRDEAILDGSGQEVGSLTVDRDGDAVASMTLSFPLSTYIPTEDDEGLDGLKAAHDADAQRGQELFLALFDAISATDKRVAARRDSASAKLQTTMDTGKAAAQAANSWRFDFSLAPDTFEGTVTVLFTLVK